MSAVGSNQRAPDLAVLPDQSHVAKQPVHAGGKAPPGSNGGSSGNGLSSTSRRRGLWLAAGGLGLLLVGLGIGLAIGLPLAFSRRNARGTAVQLNAGGEGGGGSGAALQSGTTRTYYLAAEPIDWDYVPSGRNLCSPSGNFSEESSLYVSKGVGTKLKKAVYRQYKDGSFKVGGRARVWERVAGARRAGGRGGAHCVVFGALQQQQAH
jgi:hypothetical protein